VRLKQQNFILEYLLDLDPIAAAIRAGYRSNQARQLLKHPTIRAGIAAEMQLRAERTGITAERVLAELAALDGAEPDADGSKAPGIDAGGDARRPAVAFG
jgi:phage terminase small subunit